MEMFLLIFQAYIFKSACKNRNDDLTSNIQLRSALRYSFSGFLRASVSPALR